MRMSDRSINSSEYKYGFNGQEKDDEISGEGNSYTAEFWQYDPRLGRRWNRDPIVKYHESPYASFANNPIWFSDPFGLDSISANASSEEWSDFDVDNDFVQMDEFSVSANGPETNFGSQDVERYGFNGSLEQYKEQFGYENYDDWYEENGSAFYQYAAEMDQQQQDQINMQKLFYFVQGVSTSGSFAMIALGSQVNLGVPKSFNYTPRFQYRTIYRSISIEEANSIKSLKEFSFKDFEGKQFWLTRSGLNNWNNTPFSNGLNLRATVPGRFIGPNRVINTQPQIDIPIGPGGGVYNYNHLNMLNKSVTNIRITPL